MKKYKCQKKDLYPIKGLSKCSVFKHKNGTVGCYIETKDPLFKKFIKKGWVSGMSYGGKMSKDGEIFPDVNSIFPIVTFPWWYKWYRSVIKFLKNLFKR